jgi:hypothetical protein
VILLERKKITLLISIIIICSLNVLAFFRWDYNINENDMKYKTDRWTNKTWVEFYPPLAIGSPLEFPLLNNPKFDSYAQLESYVNKIAISGFLVSEWIKRVNLTYLYYGINLFLILVILILILNLRGKKKFQSDNSPRRP